jgi:hypothetical protein
MEPTLNFEAYFFVLNLIFILYNPDSAMSIRENEIPVEKKKV